MIGTKSQPMDEKQDLHLASVSVAGFKSLKKAQVDFCPGLNIIIGKNAAGKTNLLYFLNQALNLDYEDFGDFHSSLRFENGTHYEIIAERDLFSTLQSAEIVPVEVQPRLLISGKEVGITNESGSNTQNNPLLNVNGLFYSTIFICHGIPQNFVFIDKPLTIEFDSKGVPEQIWNFMKSNSNAYFVKLFYSQFLSLDTRSLFSSGNINIGEIRTDISSKTSALLDDLVGPLKEFTPISDVRLSKNFNITINDKSERYAVSNLFLEFFVNDEWHLFSNLSDGTKRLFYIISEICANKNLLANKKRIGFPPFRFAIPQIVLIEEPELGIHPHQLHKLMAFIKEQSSIKQIILTTHSPQVLDALDNTELNRIIIAFMDNQHGTAFRKLAPHEIAKAKRYMEDDYLSDYWRFSDLEIVLKNAG
jgi:predicted ATPase